MYDLRLGILCNRALIGSPASFISAEIHVTLRGPCTRHKSCVDMVKEKIDTDAATVLAAMLVAARPFEHDVSVGVL